MKQCEHIQSLIPDAVRESASEEERTLVTQHIGQCSVCHAEYEQMHLLFSHLREMPKPDVPASYWNGLLPKIHERIEERKGIFHIPVEVMRYVLPCSAAVAVTIFMLNIGSHNVNNDASEIHSILSQLPSEEVQQLNQGDALTVLGEPVVMPTDQSTLASGDKDIIAQILQEDHKGVYSEYDLTASLTSLSDADLDGVTAILEQSSQAK